MTNEKCPMSNVKCPESHVLPEVYKVRLVLLNNLRRRYPRRLAPNEIHLQVNRTQCQPRLEYQQHAPIEQKARTDYPQSYGHYVVTRIAQNCHNTNSDAGGNE